MQYKWLRILFILAVMGMVVTACSMPGDDAGEESAPAIETAPSGEGDVPTAIIPTEDISAPVGGACDNAYYPVREGSTWNYHGTSTVTDDYNFTNTITSLRSDSFTVSIEFDNVILTQEWACTPEGILALEMGGGNAGTLRTENMNLVVETQNASGVTYPKEIMPGSTWQHTLDFTGTMEFSGQTIDVTGNTIYDYTAIGIESVTVPAGTFDAMNVQIVTTINMTSDIQGVTVPITISMTSTTWFAQGVGWVRSESTTDMAGIASTDIVELQWYNIP